MEPQQRHRLQVLRGQLSDTNTGGCPVAHQGKKVESPQNLSDVHYVVTDYKQARKLLTEGDKVTSDTKLLRPYLRYPEIARLVKGAILFTDGPDHEVARDFILPFLSVQKVKQLEGFIQQTTNELLDAMMGKEVIDYVADFAQPLPCIVVSRILGFPEEDIPQLKKWSDCYGRFLNELNDEEAEKFLPVAVEFANYVEKIIQKTRENPDVGTVFAQMVRKQKEFGWPDDTLLSNIVTLIFAGHETTTNLIGTTMALLLKHPEQMKLLRSDPSLITSTIEEVMRFRGPVHLVSRTVEEDLQVGDKSIKQGNVITINLYQANKDCDFVSNPQFDITRDKTEHLGFGFGVHYCLGRHLGRREAAVAIQTTLERFSKIELVNEELDWTRLTAFFCLKSLPLRIKP